MIDAELARLRQQWIDAVPFWHEIAVIAALRAEGRARSSGYLASILRVGYPSVNWTAEKLMQKGLATIGYRSPGDHVGGRQRMVQLKAEYRP